MASCVMICSAQWRYAGTQHAHFPFNASDRLSHQTWTRHSADVSCRLLASMRFAAPPAHLLVLPLLAQAWLLVGRQTLTTRALRVLLGAVAVACALPATFQPLLEPRERACALNFAFGIAGPYASFRAVEWALARDRARFVGYGSDAAPAETVPTGWSRLGHALSFVCRCCPFLIAARCAPLID